MKDNYYEHRLRSAQYIIQMRPVFNLRALFSDETKNFVSPMEPEAGEDVTIRFRTARDNVDVVFLVSDGQRRRMKYEKTEGSFDYYRVTVKMPERRFCYCFEVVSGRNHCFYQKTGVSVDLYEPHFFAVRAGFHTPEWAKGAVMYQIFIDRFCNGDPSNDVLDREYSYIEGYSARVTDWGKRPAAMGVREFYGGDLEGVISKLDYLKDLGIEVIYFNPLFVSPSNHKYDAQDYDHIDPHLGHLVVDEGNILQEG